MSSTTDINNSTPQKSDEQRSWLLRLESEIRSDLDAATSYEQTRDSLVLVGYGARGNGTGKTIQRPARVEYRIIELGERKWLMRSEFHLDQLTNLRSQRQLCCVGVTGFEVRIPNEIKSKQNLGRIPRTVEIGLLVGGKRQVIRYCRL